MRIALVSFEYPPDTGAGGIATYVYQAARMLEGRGHDVEVFCGTYQLDRVASVREPWGGVVNRILFEGHNEFRGAVADSVLERSRNAAFDVAEVPEWRADGTEILNRLPMLPLVVKLHTCTELISRINSDKISLLNHARRYAGAWRRGKFHPQCYEPNADPEYTQLQRCDEIVAPSLAIVKKLKGVWEIDELRLSHVPYPFTPSPELLNIPPDTHSQRVLYFGRLEPRKGVLELANAIPKVLACCPQTRFQFVGKSTPSPIAGQSMREFLQQKLAAWGRSIEFREHISNDDVPALLRDVDVCVIPSRWENFPLVCLEAMSAARGIVGSSEGGMVEQLEDGRAGLLVNPRGSAHIAAGLIDLIGNPEKRIAFGKRARERVLSAYNQERIGPLHEASYLRAIDRHMSSLKKRGCHN